MAATKTSRKSAAKKAKTAAKKTKKKGAAVGGAVPSKAKAAGKAKVSSKAAKAGSKSQAKRTTKAKASSDVLDFGEFPAGSVTRHEVTLCLSCIYKLFTNQMGLAPRTAYNEIRRYAPTVEELTAREPQRPFFKPSNEKSPRCPYCEAPQRWHAGLSVHRVEGGKAADAARKALVKKLPTKDEQFLVTEEKRTARQVFFEWLERLGQNLNFEDDDEAWMIEAARAYVERREPKADWAAAFDGARAVRRSQRIEEGWERDGARLFLAPALYNDVLLVQYLVSRSHRHGGRTFEGRLTLPDLVGRMRRGGHLDAQGITDRDRFDVLEQLVEHLTGGDALARLHFITDRRELLERARDVYDRQTG